MTVFNSRYPATLDKQALLSEVLKLTVPILVAARSNKPKDPDERLHWTRLEVRERGLCDDAAYIHAVNEADRIAWETVARLRR
jgi:hypothetical protein